MAFWKPCLWAKSPAWAGNAEKMQSLGMRTAGDLRRFERGELLNHFGRYGYRLYDLVRGTDERPVKAERKRLQISTN